MLTLYTSMHLYFPADRSINRSQFHIIKSLNLCCLISTQSISLHFIGMVEWAIESRSTYKISSHCEKFYIFFTKITKLCLDCTIALFYILVLVLLHQNFIKDLVLKLQMDHF